MTVRVTAKRQVKLPARLLSKLGIKPGDSLEIVPSGDGFFLLKPRVVDMSLLAPLRDKIPRGIKPFDVKTFRSQTYDSSLRD